MNFEDIQTDVLLQNNSPIDDFLGLSPNNMHALFHFPYQPTSPVQIRPILDNATLDAIPFLRIIESLLTIVQRDGFIKLTPLGALPKKAMVELYAPKYIPEYFVEQGITKLTRQEDSISIASARFVAELAGVVKKLKGKLSLTKKGSLLIRPENRATLFTTISEAFTERFLWASNDGYGDHLTGQKGWAFSVYMLSKFGEQIRPGEFYGEKYITAFPPFVDFFKDNYGRSPQEVCTRCYVVRTLDRFLDWFGFVSVEKGNAFLDRGLYKATPLLQQVFLIEDV